MADKLNRVAVVADLHCGSRWGLRYKPNASDPYTSPADLWLWDCWTRLINIWPEVDLLILNGDLIDGSQRKSEGTSTLTTCIDEQVDIAINCLRPLVNKAKKVIRMRGTGYHETLHGNLSTLDREFGIKRPSGDKSLVRDIYLDGTPDSPDNEKVVLNVKHNPEGSRTLYLGTTLDRETRWATLAEAAHAMPKADFIVRSHIHFASEFTDHAQGKTIITTPCFCRQQPYALEKRYYGWKPVIGGLLMERDDLCTKGWKPLVKSFSLPAVTADVYGDL